MTHAARRPYPGHSHGTAVKGGSGQAAVLHTAGDPPILPVPIGRQARGLGLYSCPLLVRRHGEGWGRVNAECGPGGYETWGADGLGRSAPHKRVNRLDQAFPAMSAQ